MTNNTATIIWIYEEAATSDYTIRRPIVVGSNTSSPQRVWRKPTIDADVESTLDKIRRSPAVVIA